MEIQIRPDAIDLPATRSLTVMTITSSNGSSPANDPSGASPADRQGAGESRAAQL